jgi:hypothetical protein
MSFARRFLTGFRETETSQPGLELNEDGTVDLVNPDGSRSTLGDGGPIPAGTNYLIADTVDSAPLASAGPALEPPLTLRSSAAADLSINADTTHIDVATTGWYIVSFRVFAQADVAVMQESIIRANLAGRTLFEVGGPTPTASIIVTTPPLSLAAGDQITFLVSGTTSDGDTWTFYGIEQAVQVFRVA